LSTEGIQQKCGIEENKKQQLREPLNSGPVELPTFRELLRQELQQQDEKARKAALHALMKRIISTQIKED
jgi:hypothetical protein